MINVYIYLDNEAESLHLVHALLNHNLAAHASIDKNNHSYLKDGDSLIEKTICVVTLQTKAILFDRIAKYVGENYRGQIKMYSVPITQCNEAFAETIRNITAEV